MDPSPSLRWQTRRFRELDLDALYAVLRLRAEVFVVEQRCAYLDPDGKDRHPDALHLLGLAADGALAAYLRILPAGVSYPEPSIGRVVTAPGHRGRGLGDPLLREALREIERRWPGTDVRIGAQAHLGDYYGRHGFVADSEPYLEDGIAHIDMMRRAGGESSP
ncbi:GNAT family N-acetyltransferase [Luteimonas sp. SJ-92]|uniref:GNAT family N-acetyltransferase n=1 Tax=Luteimonas salinisoli TaxID=2752307 RepID=A0A853JF58_9GAMM|nr:GNAT family N-acetyltransferase [Luteimonas salinisoli]NZA27180.1 GNAT family N-acetyltransferase [Luteimonas salinisoli]